MKRCPICKGRLQENICSRCGADLAMLLTIEQQAASQLNKAIFQLSKGNLNQAKLAVENSLQLKREPLAVVLY
ncbi:MAG: hypothetical protein IMF12_00525, partial [Proteobacteria bacterium]|nr:hypothetical protein [Pseudomonadota bacterium]